VTLEMRVVSSHTSGGNAGRKKNSLNIEGRVLFCFGDHQDAVIIDSWQVNDNR
jgi:hypothetical protein